MLDPESGLTLNGSGNFLSSNIYGIPIANFSMLHNKASEFRPPSLQAIECNLFWCTNTYFATVTNFNFQEELLSSTPNKSGPASSSRVLEEPYFWTRPDPPYHNHSFFDENSTAHSFSPDSRYSEESLFSINSTASLQLSDWLRTELTNIASAIGSATKSSSFSTVPPLELSNVSQVERTFANIATSMTIILRRGSFNGNVSLPNYPLGFDTVNGTAWTSMTYLHVRWVWLTLPICLVLLTFVFLLITIGTSRHLNMAQWKSSTLPLLFNSLPYSGREDLGTQTHPAEMETMAKQLEVQLRRANLGWRLSRKKRLMKVSAKRARV